MIRLAWRLLWREMRSGELRLLFGALCIAVAAVSAVGFFAQRVHLALENEARLLIGGDLVLVSDHPWAPGVVEEIGRRGLTLAQTQGFTSMVQAAGRLQLVDVKAVSGNYPLRGKLLAAATLGGAETSLTSGPPAGAVWIDERLAGALQVDVGDSVQLGASRLRVAAILIREPDRGLNVFNLAPRLLMHVDDLPASRLIAPGARVGYRLLLGGDTAALADFRGWLDSRLERGQRIEDASNARPEIRSALDRAERFLGLSALLAVVVAAVGVALATRRYLQRQLDACAVMRCLGATQGSMLRLQAGIFAGLALAATLLGGALGLAVHLALVAGVSGLLDIHLPPPDAWPLIQAAAVACVLLFGFAGPALLQLARVPTLRVLRREFGAPALSSLGGRLLGLSALAGLIFVAAGDVRLGGLAVAGFGIAALLFAACAWLVVRLLSVLRGLGSPAWRQGLGNLARHRSAAVLQITTLAVGMLAMLLLTVTRSELLDAWQRSLPADAPNRFAINIQPEQAPAFAAHLARAGVTAELAPMVRARLLEINGRTVSAASYPDDDRAQRLVEREFNLSWRVDAPAGNRIVDGAWFPPGSDGQPLASVEAGLAKTLGITVGDEIVFAVAGQQKRLRVSSLRRLDWDSMRVNFFVLVPPGVIDDAPASQITSFHLPPGRPGFARELLAEFPNVTLIDIDAVLEQLRQMVGQLAGAVQFVFLFTLAAGLVVLLAALLGAFDERRHELALMRALGAGRRQLQRALFVELAAIGAGAGGIAGLGALLLGQLLARRVFEIAPTPDFLVPVLAAAAGALATGVLGWLLLRRLLDMPPMQVLRAAA